MKFAVLNSDADTLPAIRGLLAEGHEFTAFFGGEPTVAAELKIVAPGAAVIAEWEGVLAGSNEAVVVGCAGPAEQRFEQLKRLVQERMPTLVAHPFSLAALDYHELDMNRQATGSAIVPFEPTRVHPAFVELRSKTLQGGAANPAARIEQIVVDRQATIRTRESILTHLVRDVGTARLLAGECQKVSALGTLPEAASHGGGDSGQLGAQIVTADGVLIRWSIGPVVRRAGATFTIIHARGDEPKSEVSPSQTIDLPETPSAPVGDSAVDVAALTAALGDAANALWRDAMRDMELVDAVERSLRRGRTVELLHEEASEHGTFRGVMAAGGCLFLMIGMATAVAAAVFGRFRFAIANFWPYALLALLAVFLVMQLFKLAFPPEHRQ